MVREQDLFKDKEKVVVDIMMVLYDEQEILRSYVESEVHEAVHEARLEERREATYEANIKMAKRLLKMKKLSFEEIAVGSGLSVEEVEELARETE